MSRLTKVSAEVSKSLRTGPFQSRLASIASEVHDVMHRKTAAVDREAEWQRVHSYIADVLKDTHVLYAKLARLEGDFAGEELTRLERISEAVLQLGNELSAFSKAFYEGKYDMAQSQTYGDGERGDNGNHKPPSPPEEDGAAAALLGEEQGEEAVLEGEDQGEEESQERSQQAQQ